MLRAELVRRVEMVNESAGENDILAADISPVEVAAPRTNATLVNPCTVPCAYCNSCAEKSTPVTCRAPTPSQAAL